jgi:nucleotide-binding universal stress UspA family protein
MSFKRILIAVDDSEFAEHAADVGIELAKSLQADVGFVHVFDPSVGPSGMWGVTAETLMEMSEQAAKHLLATFRERIASSYVPEFIESGKPASKTVEVAKNWPADLIVMGSHGRGKIHGLFLGSVSQEVLHHASCPVLVVRAQA